MVTASDRAAVSFSLSSGNASDGPEGRKLLSLTPHDKAHRYLIMDRAYEGDKTRLLAIHRGYIPVVPPKRNRKSPWEYSRELYKRRKRNRKSPWEYSRELYKRRSTVERFFLHIKRFRKIFTRYDKLDIIFSGFILFAMVIDAIV